MRMPFVFITALAACSQDANHLGNPLLWPVYGLSAAIDNSIYGAKRGKVEVFVKSNHAVLIEEIGNKGGAYLQQAMDLSGVKMAERDALLLALYGDKALYIQSPDALVTTLMVYGN